MASNWAVGCQECPAGTYNAVQGNEYCTACPAGTSSSSVGASSCPACNPGQYSSDAGSTECSVCGAGSISNAGNGVSGSTACMNCEPGQSSSSGSSVCEPCDPGYYSSATTGYICTKAQAGYYVGADQTLQYPCPVGSYSASGAQSCISCPFNQSTQNARSNSSSFCVECPYGVDASTYACIDVDETSPNPLSNICWDASQLLSLDASPAVQDLYDLVYHLPDFGMNALIQEAMNIIQGAAEGTSTIEDIETVLEKLQNAPENWLDNLSINLDSCVQSVNKTIYDEAETDLYYNRNLFQYQFGEDSQHRIEWIANWICSGATFGCASFNQSACPQANSCFAPIYQNFASFLSYSGGSAFGNYQNLNTGRNTPMYSPGFISDQLESNVESLANWDNAYESFQIYLKAMDQIKEGFTFTADAFDATMQVESVKTSVSQQSSQNEGNLYYKQAEYNFKVALDISEIVQYGAAYCPSGSKITADGIPDDCTTLSQLINECEREIEFDTIMHIITETVELAALLASGVGDAYAVEDIGGEATEAGEDIGEEGEVQGAGENGDNGNDNAPGGIGSNDNDLGGENGDNGNDNDPVGSNANVPGEDGDGDEDNTRVDDGTDVGGNSEVQGGGQNGDNGSNDNAANVEDGDGGDATTKDSNGGDKGSEHGTHKKNNNEKNAAAMTIFADSFQVIGALPATSAAFLQASYIPKDVSWNPQTQLPPPPTSNADGSFANPKYANGSYQWYLNGQKVLSDSLVDMSPARWDAIYLENEQQLGPSESPRYAEAIFLIIYTQSSRLQQVPVRNCVKSMSNYGSAMTTAAMALDPIMGNIAVSIATQNAINTADEKISGTVDKPDPLLTTAPSEYDSVSNTLFYSQYKNTSNEILSYSPAVSLTQQQYTAAKSIFEFCTSFAYMNGGRPYESDADGHTANCADFGNLYLPSNKTFEATIFAFDGTNSSIIGPPSSVDELNDRIIGFANNVQNSPQAVGQTRQELGSSVETFAIEFTKERNASYYYDLKNGTIMFTLSASSNLLLQSTTPFGIYDANPRVVNTQTYWRGVTSPDGQFVTTTINPIGPYM
eukprot:scaffold9477_cov84-Skeletonema_dohrnii-CCMP3373.AAC.1